MKNIIPKIKDNKKIMVILSGTFVLIIVATVATVNYTFGFKVSNVDNESDMFPESYYLSKSECVDVNGNSIKNNPIYDGQVIMIDPSQTSFCKLEFDLPGSSIITYDPSKSHANQENEECHDVQCALDRLYSLYKGD